MNTPTDGSWILVSQAGSNYLLWPLLCAGRDVTGPLPRTGRRNFRAGRSVPLSVCLSVCLSFRHPFLRPIGVQGNYRQNVCLLLLLLLLLFFFSQITFFLN